MTQKLTPEEKLANKLLLTARKKTQNQLNYIIGFLFCVCGFLGALFLTHITSDSALLFGFLGGIGFSMLSILSEIRN
jgi:cyanate permease